MPAPRRLSTDAPWVLLVDDSADEREMYAECLRSAGYRTLQASNTVDAFRFATELRPHVAVVDVRLPGDEDGLALVKRLRGHGATRHLSIVVLTGCVFDADRTAATLAGCDLFLGKPCLPDALVGDISRLLRLDAPRLSTENDTAPR